MRSRTLYCRTPGHESPSRDSGVSPKVRVTSQKVGVTDCNFEATAQQTRQGARMGLLRWFYRNPPLKPSLIHLQYIYIWKLVCWCSCAGCNFEGCSCSCHRRCPHFSQLTSMKPPILQLQSLMTFDSGETPKMVTLQMIVKWIISSAHKVGQ